MARREKNEDVLPKRPPTGDFRVITPENIIYHSFWSALAAHSSHELCFEDWNGCFSEFLEDDALAGYLLPKNPDSEGRFVFNYDLLHERAATALPVMAMVRDANAPMTWHLGGLHFGTTRRKRIYLSYLKPEELLMCASCILAVDKLPSFLLTPFHHCLTERVRSILNALEITTLPVEDVLNVNRYGRVALRRPLYHKLAEYATQEMAASLKARTFPVPAGIEWKDIRIHFLDNHTVTCTVGRSHSTFNFKDMGMENRHTGQPNLSWLLLRSLATLNGFMPCDWALHKQAERAQQIKQRLCNALKHFFDKSDNPIRWDCDRVGYTWDLIIRSESHSTNYHRKIKK